MTNTDREIKVDVSEDKEIIEELVGTTKPEAEPQPKPAANTAADPADEITSPDNPLKLKKPILINGHERKELRWTDDITSEQFLEADSRAHGSRASIATAEMDTGFHFWLGVMMIVAANPEIDPKDLEQVKGRDIPSLMRIGRFFMLPGQGED